MPDALPVDQHFTIARYWEQGDAVSHAVACVLLAMSLASWFFILSRAYSSWRIRAAAPALALFWGWANEPPPGCLMQPKAQRRAP